MRKWNWYLTNKDWYGRIVCMKITDYFYLWSSNQFNQTGENKMSNGHEGEEIYNSKCYKELERSSLLCPNVEFYAVVNVWDGLFEIYEGKENIPSIDDRYNEVFEFYFINGEEHNVEEN